MPYIMSGLLVIGFFCNLMIKAVDPRFHMKESDTRGHRPALEKPPAPRHKGGTRMTTNNTTDPTLTVKLAAAWLFVGIPLAWGASK